MATKLYKLSVPLVVPLTIIKGKQTITSNHLFFTDLQLWNFETVRPLRTDHILNYLHTILFFCYMSLCKKEGKMWKTSYIAEGGIMINVILSMPLICFSFDSEPRDDWRQDWAGEGRGGRHLQAGRRKEGSIQDKICLDSGPGGRQTNTTRYSVQCQY